MFGWFKKKEEKPFFQVNEDVPLYSCDVTIWKKNNTRVCFTLEDYIYENKQEGLADVYHGCAWVLYNTEYLNRATSQLQDAFSRKLPFSYYKQDSIQQIISLEDVDRIDFGPKNLVGYSETVRFIREE